LKRSFGFSPSTYFRKRRQDGQPVVHRLDLHAALELVARELVDVRLLDLRRVQIAEHRQQVRVHHAPLLSAFAGRLVGLVVVEERPSELVVSVV
jgi:hypothetical protein